MKTKNKHTSFMCVHVVLGSLVVMASSQWVFKIHLRQLLMNVVFVFTSLWSRLSFRVLSLSGAVSVCLDVVLSEV